MNYGIGKLIKELRIEKNMSQTELASSICSKEYISKIENGHKIPSERILKSLFNQLGENVSFYFPLLSITDSFKFISDKKQIDFLLYTHEIEQCFDYINSLKNTTLYSCDEPLQYLLGKEAFLLAKYKTDYENAFYLSIQSIVITKPEFTISSLKFYHFYSIEELWGLFNISYILYKNSFLDKTNPIDILIKIILFLDEGFFNYDMISQLYPLSCSYLSIMLKEKNELAQAKYYIQKGIDFFNEHYALPLDFLSNLQKQAFDL